MKVSLTLSYDEIGQIRSFCPEAYREGFESFLLGANEKLRNNKFVNVSVSQSDVSLTYEKDFMLMINDVEDDMGMDVKMLINGYINIVLGFINTIKESKNVYKQKQKETEMCPGCGEYSTKEHIHTYGICIDCINA